MSEDTRFKYGQIDFSQIITLDKATIRYVIIPNGFLAQNIEFLDKIYIFKTYTEMENYFTDQSKPNF